MTSNFLDVEDDEQRQRRVGALLERLSTTSAASPNRRLAEPPTELLARVRAFLPAISASNRELSQMDPKDVDIENVPENEAQYIEMNLGLGVFEATPSGSRSSTVDTSSSESESGSASESSPDSSQDSEDSLSSSSDSGSSVDMRPIESRVFKPLPRRVSQPNRGCA